MFYRRLTEAARGTLTFIPGLGRPYLTRLALGVVLSLASSGLSLAIPLLAGHFVASLIQTGQTSLETPLLLALAAILTLNAVLTFSSSYVLGSTSERITADLRTRVQTHLLTLPLSFFHTHRKGDILSLVSSDSVKVGRYLSSVLVQAAPALLMAAGAGAMMVLLDPLLGLAVLVLLPMSLILARLRARRIHPIARSVAAQHATSLSVAEESLEMAPIIKAFVQEEEAAQDYTDESFRLRDLSIDLLWEQTKIAPFTRLASGLLILSLVWLAGSRIEAGTMSAADATSLLFYGFLMARPLSLLADLFGRTRALKASTDRLQKVFSTAPEGNDDGQAVTVSSAPLEIEFRGVSFGYDDREGTLEDINFRILPGETVAFTGPNGAGKTTLIYLLLRFYDPQKGQILLDGEEITQVSLKQHRSQFGLVPQDTHLFNRTIAENIALGRNNFTLEEIVAAARAARAHDFIVALPEGYRTAIGDRGVRLSGGQKQRLALARVFLRHSPILIWDEATSMFDPEGEEELVSLGRELLRDRTVILVTHRPAALALADRVLRVQEKSVVELDVTSAPQPASF